MSLKSKKKNQKPSLSKKEVQPILEKSANEGVKKTKIRVIGLGGGGGNIISDLAAKISKASFVAANTDVKALKNCSKKVAKFQFGQALTQGLGTGMNAELAKEAALSEKERIRKLCQDQDLCILVASLGGGTGSGAISTFAKISKNLGNLTYGIFTLPFKFEGEKKMEIALNALKEARNYLNVMTIIPNERVFQIIDKETPLKEALAAINKFLSESLGGLIETIYEPGLINIDFADFRTILEGNGKLAFLNIVEERRKDEAIKDLAGQVLSSPLYPYTIKGAKGVLFNIVGERNLSLAEVNQVSKAIADLVNPEAKIIFGISQRSKQPQTVKTILLATDCDRGTKFVSVKPDIPKKPKKRKKPVVLKSLVKKEPEEKKATLSSKKKKEEKPAGQQKKTEIKKKKKLALKKVKVKVKEKTKEVVAENNQNEERVRKNALQIKQEVEELEKEMAEKEKFWEVPAFLRKRTEKS